MWVHHIGPGFGYRPWWSPMGGLIPLLLLGVLIVVLVWAVLRVTKERAPAGGMSFAGQVPAQARPLDAAVERARMRYAQGEMGREEFLQVTKDRGGEEPPAPAPPDAPTALPSETPES
jgi:uncharacterized membrane protein